MPVEPALPAVLVVDDDESLLTGLSRTLRGRYALTLATTPGDALQHLSQTPFAVVLSDMRMPEMSGTELLKRARALQPQAERLILSGHSDLEAAAAAINEGGIFRFLLKPATRDTLVSALDAALEHRRLQSAEKELLERTLTGAIDAMTEALALASPHAFGRARRLKRIVLALADELHVVSRWKLEVAASLQELGAISLPPEVAERVVAGDALDEVERQMVSKAASLPAKLLGHIPRLEPVIALIDALHAEPGPDESLEVSILRAAALVERRTRAGVSFEAVLEQLELEHAVSREVLAALHHRGPLVLGARRSRQVALASLQPGMVLAEDVKTRAGALLITRGHEVSESLMQRLRNFAATVGVKEPLTVAQTELDEAEATLGPHERHSSSSSS